MMGPAGYWYTLPQGCQGTSQNPLPQGGDEGRERFFRAAITRGGDPELVRAP